MENAVTESDRLSGVDENVCILHDNTQNVFLGSSSGSGIYFHYNLKHEYRQ